MLLSNIQFVTGGFSLLAFIVAAIFYGYREHLRQRQKIISSASRTDRIIAIDKTADWLRIDPGPLSQIAKERIIIQVIISRRRRDLMVFIACLFFGAVLLGVTILYPYPGAPEPIEIPDPPPITQPPPKPSLIRTLKHPDVAREGHATGITVTLVANGGGGGSFNVDFNWSGSPGGTWSGSQTAIFTILGAEGQPLQSITVQIDRSGCFYGSTGGPNHQTSSGVLLFDPNLAANLQVTLSEVHNRNEGAC